MASNTNEIAYEFPPLFRVYKDGHVDRLMGTETCPPSAEPETETGVRSKDITISPETGLSARLFLPRTTAPPPHKLPLLIYIHGGAFCIESPFSPTYHNYVASLVAEANIIAVSVHYRRPPEHHLPIAYDDSWAAIQWAVTHSAGEGPEPWLNNHVDFERVFVAGDSAGANIAHNMAMRAGAEKLSGARIAGVVIVHPYFGNNEPDKLMDLIFPTSSGCGDPRRNPGMDGRLWSLGCSRVVVWVAEKDEFRLRDRGWAYYEAVRKSGWKGKVEFVETEGEGHVFHLLKPGCEKAIAMLKQVASFINQED